MYHEHNWFYFGRFFQYDTDVLSGFWSFIAKIVHPKPLYLFPFFLIEQSFVVPESPSSVTRLSPAAPKVFGGIILSFESTSNANKSNPNLLGPFKAPFVST